MRGDCPIEGGAEAEIDPHLEQGDLGEILPHKLLGVVRGPVIGNHDLDRPRLLAKAAQQSEATTIVEIGNIDRWLHWLSAATG